MAKSKSGSGSIVKSIESMLPKGISLMHVVLALVLGLMICSFMNDSVVEGQANGKPCLKDVTKDGTTLCANKDDQCVNPNTGEVWSGSESTAPPVNICMTPAIATATATAYAGGKANEKATESTAQAAATKALSADWKIRQGTIPAGVCVAPEGVDVKVNSTCGAQATAAACGGAAGDACTWRDCKDPTLSKSDYGNFVNCLADTGSYNKAPSLLQKTLSDAAALKWMRTSELEIPDTLPTASAGAQNAPGGYTHANGGGSPSDTNYKINKPIPGKDTGDNFLDALGCARGTRENPPNCDNSNYLNSTQKEEIRKEIQDCQSGWTEDDAKKDMYGYLYNNQPIFGYNQTHGLVCRNPFYESYKIKGPNSRIHWGSGCGDGECPCTLPKVGRTDPHANDFLTDAEKKQSVLDRGMIYARNAVGLGLDDGRCDLDERRVNNPWACFGPSAVDKATTAIGKLAGNALTGLAVGNDCKKK